MNLDSSKWEVIIEERGRCGVIRYMEGQKEIRFDWELGSGSSIALIWGPKEETWNEIYRWAVARRRQVYERVAENVILQKAPSCKFALDLNTSTIDIYKPETSE